MGKKIILKYNQDDILEIVTEYMAAKHGFEEFNGKAMLYGAAGRDLRVVAVIGDLEDESISSSDLNAIDEMSDYNGDHSQTCWLAPSDLSKIKLEIG